MNKPIRVLLADDSALVRRGIRFMLNSKDDFEIVGEAVDGQDAITLVQSLEPDVVLMDISMPRLDGLQATAMIQHMDTAPAVLILSIHSDATFVRRAMLSGARGYLLKRSLSEELLSALYRVQEGKCYVSPPLKAHVRNLLEDRCPHQ